MFNIPMYHGNHSKNHSCMAQILIILSHVYYKADMCNFFTHTVVVPLELIREQEKQKQPTITITWIFTKHCAKCLCLCPTR